ncbi:hypothetical protein CSUI_005217, partial [Cystoisospora suis]
EKTKKKDRQGGSKKKEDRDVDKENRVVSKKTFKPYTGREKERDLLAVEEKASGEGRRSSPD